MGLKVTNHPVARTAGGMMREARQARAMADLRKVCGCRAADPASTHPRVMLRLADARPISRLVPVAHNNDRSRRMLPMPDRATLRMGGATIRMARMIAKPSIVFENPDRLSQRWIVASVGGTT